MSDINYPELVKNLQSKIETLKLDVQYELHLREQIEKKYLELVAATKEFTYKINSLVDQ